LDSEKERRGRPAKAPKKWAYCALRLRAWITSTKKISGKNPYAQIAQLIGVSSSTTYKICSGARRPSKQLAARIEKVTEGELMVADWFPELATSAPKTPEQQAEIITKFDWLISPEAWVGRVLHLDLKQA